MMFENDSIIENIESWFIPLDIILILSTSFSLILSIIYLIIIIIDKRCYTIPMMLVANSCLAELIFASDMLSMAIFTFYNDFKQIQSEDSLCIYRGYLGYVVTILQYYSYFLQSLYRYQIVLYPNHFYYRSFQCQVFLIVLIWIFACLCPLPYLLTNQIKYNVHNQICQMALRLSFLTIYNALCVYFIPIFLTIFIYYKLIRYVRKMRQNVRLVNELNRAERELKMVRRLVILLIGLTTIGFPYALFVLLSFFTSPPLYHFRIAYVFVDVSLVFVMVALFQFTEPLKESILRRINRRENQILPAIT